MAAPRRTEDHQETDKFSRAESACTPGTSSQEVKKHVAKRDSGVGKLLYGQAWSHSNQSGSISGLFERLEVSPPNAKVGNSESKVPCEGKSASSSTP
jgi:hypothetical protein